jgi:hypothetical protein
LPPALARAISAAGHNARHVFDAGLLHAGDDAIWALAEQHGDALVSKDEDFVAIRVRSASTVPVVWLRIRNAPKAALIAWFLSRLPQVTALISAGETLIELR